MTKNKTNKTNKNVPNFDKLILPTVKAIKSLGGSGTNDEINEKASEFVNISDEILQIQHGDSGSETEFNYRLAWARTYLKKYGIIENSARGVWSLVDADLDVDSINKDDVVKTVREQSRPANKQNSAKETVEAETIEIEETADTDNWRDKLLDILQSTSPSGFERICQRLLRESGFKKVVVTGKSSDGGIDGEGILEINPLMTFKVLFQAKRYQGSVGAPVIRDFRGAMQGRADKGIILTTGRFTQEAKKEAIRDGAHPVELVDGEALVDLFEKNELGLKPKTVYDIDHSFFREFMD